MRPGQNKRMRGRNNNGGGGNRKGPNPLTRSYESNGPDVKIRGTAHHVGEKYLQLARDAQSSGDPVMAESYLQHAEHYFRLIAAAQQAQAQAAYGYQRPAGEPVEADDDDGDDDFSNLPDRFASPAERVVTPPQPAPQPYGERQHYNGNAGGNGGERGSYEPRGERFDRSNQDRPHQDRSNQDRPNQDRPNQMNGDRPAQQNEGRYNRQDRQGERQPYGERFNRQDRPSYQDRPAYADRSGQERHTSNERHAPNERHNAGERPAPAERPDRAAEAGAPERQVRDYDNRGPRPNRFRDQPREQREPRMRLF